MDAIVPITFAGTDMVFPTNRSLQRWSMVSPSGANATVEIYDGTILAWGLPDGSGDVTLSAFKGKKPVALIFGSYT